MRPSGFWPFAIAAGATKRIDTSGLDVPGKLKLDVVTGGPVFAWFGRESQADAVRRTTPTQNGGDVEFDLACSAVGDAEREVEAGISTLTVFASVDTVGFFQFVPHHR